MQPTGMSLERCVAALNLLDGDLKIAESKMDAAQNGAPALAPATPDALLHLVSDLTLNIDLRRDAASSLLMSDVESTVYFPLIEKVLKLLENKRMGKVDAIGEARQLTRVALKTAIVAKN